MTAKRDFKERLQAQGLWVPFVKLRERIRKELLAGGWALKDAAKECQARAEEQFADGVAPAPQPPGLQPVQYIPRGGGSPAFEGSASDAGDEGDEDLFETNETPPVVDAGTPISTPRPSAPAGGDSDIGLTKAFWEGKAPASAFEEVNWVAQNWMLEDVTAADAPSPGAWGLRTMVKENHTFRGDFFRTIWSKTLPTKQQLELAERYRDDGRAGFELFDRLEQAIQADVQRQAADETATPRLSIWENAEAGTA